MIDFGVDMNYIQDGLIPSKYFEKSIERLVSANGTQMKIKYELNNVHVCHGNACFKIPFVLVKNMTDKVILGLTFINALYPFLVDHNGITTDPFRHEIKFKFASKFEIDTDDALNLIHAKVKHLNFLKQEVRYKKIANNFLINCCNPKLIIFRKCLLMLFALMFLMLFGIGRNILLTCHMLKILMRKTFPLKLVLFK